MVEVGEGGAIVNISSAAGVTGFLSRTAYVSSKHGIVGLTKTAALELAPHGIRVNAVAPGFTLTGLTAHYQDDAAMAAYVGASTPLGRFGTATEVADVVAFVAGPQASFMTGSVLVSDGGLLAGQPSPTGQKDLSEVRS
jgi:NAD(P)-dependent dehydrogenase (short-subunit alcohol dehydrogenase family)